MLGDLWTFILLHHNLKFAKKLKKVVLLQFFYNFITDINFCTLITT